MPDNYVRGEAVRLQKAVEVTVPKGCILVCARSGMLQAASAVPVTVVLCDLAALRFFRTSQCCTVVNPVRSTRLFPRNTGQVAVIKAGDYRSGDKTCKKC